MHIQLVLGAVTLVSNFFVCANKSDHWKFGLLYSVEASRVEKGHDMF